MSEPHPDYLAAPEALRWTGRVNELWDALRHEATGKVGLWAVRVLPTGLAVQVQASADRTGFRYLLRIARPGEESEAFTAEVGQLLHDLAPGFGRRWQTPEWSRGKTKSGRAVLKAESVSLFHDEVAKQTMTCPGPGDGTPCPGARTIIDDPAFKPNRCEWCAIAAGNVQSRGERRKAARVPDPQPGGST
jgi:hypothetical protein